MKAEQRARVIKKEKNRMKIIHEYYPDSDEGNDRFELALIRNAYEMYEALTDMSEYLRRVRKGYESNDVDKIIETIQKYIVDSKVYEIE